MSLTTAPRCRKLVRTAGVGLVVAASTLLGAPAASAAEDERPAVALDPPDAFVFLLPEQGGGEVLDWTEEMAAAGGDGAAAAALAGAADLPPEFAAAMGAEGDVTTQTDGEYGGVHVLYGGAVDLQLPAQVDASSAVFTLDVQPPDPRDLPRRYKSNPMPSDQPLTVTSSGSNQFTLALPGEVSPYGPLATLTVDGLTDAGTGADLLVPLVYNLEFSASAPGTVLLQPVIALIARAECSVYVEESCPGPTVRAGTPVDLVVPPGSLLAALGLGQLDTAFYGLGPMDDEEPYVFYDSETNPELVTVHRPRAATLHVPADARPGPYVGTVLTVDPEVGVAMTFFEIDVEGVPVNPGLHSDTGWVDEVREVSPGSTAALAGGALLLVGGLVTAVAVRPARRPPLGG